MFVRQRLAARHGESVGRMQGNEMELSSVRTTDRQTGSRRAVGLLLLAGFVFHAAAAPARTAGPEDTVTPTVTATPGGSTTEDPATSPTPSPTPTQPCLGDCDGNASVGVNELITSVRISLDESPITDCFAADLNLDLYVTINELIGAVNSALYGCGMLPPTPLNTPTFTSSPSPSPTQSATATFVPTLSPTRSPTPTLTPSPTLSPTRTPTPIGTPSVCGGFVGAVPQLCHVQVDPAIVPLFGTFRIKYCLADLDGDVIQLCVGIQTLPLPPPLVCTPVSPTGRIVNQCFTSAPVPSTNPAGNYVLHLEARDRAGHRSGTQTAQFSVR